MKTTKNKDRIYICHTYYHAYIAVVKELIERKKGPARSDIMLSTMSNDFGTLSERLRRADIFENVYMYDEKEDVTSEEVMSYHRDKGNIVLNLMQRITYIITGAIKQDQTVVVGKNFFFFGFTTAGLLIRTSWLCSQ
jgi:hypothetical protein